MLEQFVKIKNMGSKLPVSELKIWTHANLLTNAVNESHLMTIFVPCLSFANLMSKLLSLTTKTTTMTTPTMTTTAVTTTVMTTMTTSPAAVTTSLVPTVSLQNVSQIFFNFLNLGQKR